MKSFRYALLVALMLIALPITSFAQNTKYHIVEAGQTVYSIAKQYGVTTSAIENLNALKDDAIHPGDKLILPADAKMPIGNISGSDYKELYEVKKKDNLYRIALNYGVTIDELLAVNPDLTADSKLKKGSKICIPYTAAEKAEAKKKKEEEERRRAAEEAARKPKPQPMQTVRAAVILPFKSTTKEASIMLEFYRGMLMAVDSVKNEGTNVEIMARHSGSTEADINNLLKEADLASVNVIFGPLSAAQAEPLSKFCKEHGIRLVMPFKTTANKGLENPLAYVVTDQPENVQAEAVERIAKQLPNANYIFVENGKGDEKGTEFSTALRKQVNTRGSSIKIINLADGISTLSTALSTLQRNVLVINDTKKESLATLEKNLETIAESHPSYKISIVGSPDYLNFTGEVKSKMYEFDTYAYNSFYRDGTRKDVQKVEQRYTKRFNKKTDNATFNLLGYDLGYYFLHGLATYGGSFEALQNDMTYKPLQHRMDFKRVAEGQGFINRNVFLIHFTPTNQIEMK